MLPDEADQACTREETARFNHCLPEAQARRPTDRLSSPKSPAAIARRRVPRWRGAGHGAAGAQSGSPHHAALGIAAALNASGMSSGIPAGKPAAMTFRRTDRRSPLTSLNELGPETR